ncbi:potassium channel family protein [Cohnella lubricantis]|uniref:Ion transporter n=1 Tax=Cohnella lubricantis TaxID=2163172 RepID=A0A841TBD9_9BACL|nr:potassium channel family protein [Cohnella lubricantis]MBB6677349.1 ion transporter [Cohnella lubricantis]MBP2119013.1 voltage-gated potassium channel [Cohnella lubricantis]
MPLILRLLLKTMQFKNTSIAMTALFFILACASIAYALEPDTFAHWFNALYWVLTTMSTVGYGDYYMKTYLGKALTIFLYIFGVGLLSLLIGKVIDSVASIHRQREAGQLSYQGKGHIIIINWSKKAHYAVEEILATNADAEIVILDEIDRHPLARNNNVHFISGDPASEETLEKANLKGARSAILFADSRIEEAALADGKSLLIASSIERIAPDVHTTVEIMQERNIQNFRYINVNDFVLSYDAISRLAVRAALQEGNSEIINQLLSRQRGDDIYEVPVLPGWRTYGDAFQELIRKGATLISDRGDMSINRKLDTPIPKEARLFVIANGETYRSIAGKE